MRKRLSQVADIRGEPQKILHSSYTGQKWSIFVNYISDLQVTDIMVGETGFEPATLWSQTRCATRLRYSPTWDHWYNNVRAAGYLPTSRCEAGGPGGTRTPDLAVMSGQL